MIATRTEVRRHLITSAMVTVPLAAALLLSGCAGVAGDPRPTTPAGSSDPLQVVATTTVLADLAAQAGGDLVEVSSLVPKGAEVHTFDPSPRDATLVARADLVVMNGLGLDEWLRDVVESAASPDIPVIELAEDLDCVQYLASAEHGEEEPGHEEGEEEIGHDEEANPHLWLNVAYAEKYVMKLTAALVAADPDHAAVLKDRSAVYRQRLAQLDATVREQLAAVPPQRRRVISVHEAFPYLADAYGLEIVGTVVDAPGQEPSAGEVAALVDTIRESGAVAVFAESQFPDDLVDTISAETGIAVVTDLYNDSLGDPPVDTYEGLIRWDVERIVSVLSGP
jgi:manganese/iron transport system substrate-binding protein